MELLEFIVWLLKKTKSLTLITFPSGLSGGTQNATLITDFLPALQVQGDGKKAPPGLADLNQESRLEICTGQNLGLPG